MIIDPKKYKWLEKIKMKYNYERDYNDFIFQNLTPFQHGLSCHDNRDSYSILRNGCIHARHVAKNESEYDADINMGAMSATLMNVIHAAKLVAEHIEYTGGYDFIFKIVADEKVKIYGKDDKPLAEIDGWNVTVSRKFSMDDLVNEDKSVMDIMDELYNSFGKNKCEYFDTDGKWSEF